ncbi:MAG: dehydratase [Gordonia sp.]|nr:dehydratase [Gordonia sp. (in: high G+C Gram-positive bacteria)]
MSSVPDLVRAAGSVLGTSEWLMVDQSRIDLFAEATGDTQWIHVDAVRASDGPFGTTIAHGFLTLSLLPYLMRQTYQIDGEKHAVNYGLDRVRFPHPVRSGESVRAEVTLSSVEIKGTAAQVKFSTVIEIQDRPKPACVAESLILYFFE